MARSILAQLVVALQDNASAPAKALSGTLKGLEKNAVDFAKTMSGARWGDAFRKQAGRSEAFAKDLDRARTSARDLGAALANASWGSKFSDQLAKLKVAPREFDAIRRSWQQLQRELATPSGWRGAAGSLGATTEWKKRQLLELASVRAEMHRLRQESEAPLRLLRRGGRTVAMAAGVYGGAHVVNRAGRGLAIAGASEKREGFRQNLAGLTEPERKAIVAESNRLTGLYPSISSVDLQELARGARNLTGDVRRGLDLLPDIARARVAIQSATGEPGDGDLDRLMKAGDIAGLQDNPDRFRAFLENFTKAVQVEGKQLNASDYLAFFKRAKMAGAGFGDDFIAAAMPTLSQELGGASAGTALATAYQQFVSGRAKKEVIAAHKEAGLRDKSGNLVDRQEFIANPFEWIQKHIRPLLEKSGVDMNNNQAMLDFLTPLTSDRNAAEVVSKSILQADQIRRNQRMYKGARGLAGAEEARHEDPFVAGAGAINALKNAAAELAGPVMPAATSALNTFADTMNGLAKRLREDPSIAKQASATATGAAAGGGLGGGIMALRALWQGRGMGGALAGLLKGGAIGGLGGGILGYGASKLGDWLSSAAGNVGKVAAGRHWKPQAGGEQADLERQLQDAQARIASIKAKTHPSRANEPNAEVDRLELEAADLRNRIAAGRQTVLPRADHEARRGRGFAGIGQSIEPGPDYQQAATAAADAKAKPRFRIDNLPEREQGSAASNSLFAPQKLAEQSPDPRLTKTAAPSGLFSPASVLTPPAAAPAPTVDAAAAASNGQAAGSALGTGVAAGIAAQAPAAEAQGRSLMERIKALFAGGVTVPVNVQQSGGAAAPAAASSPAVPARASGGSVYAGGLYQINEYDQEYFSPAENGTIVDPRRMGGGGGSSGGGPVSVNMGGINLSISGASDPQAVVEQVVAAINDRVQEAARAAFSDMGVELG